MCNQYWKEEVMKTIARMREQHRNAVLGSQSDLHKMKTGLATLEIQVTLMSIGDSKHEQETSR
jgi:hypothetical protein